MATIADIKSHYDVNHRSFLEILDPDFLAYSCGHWAGTQNAKLSQLAKFEYIASKVNLRENKRVLEVGCGWGSFATFCAAQYPDVDVTGLTMSEEQRQFVLGLGLPNFHPVLSDWRDFTSNEPYDAIVSIESLEHYASMDDRRTGRHVDVYRHFFQKCDELSSSRAPLYVQSSIVRANPTDIQGYRDARLIVERVFTGSALATLSSLQSAATGIYEFEELLLRGPDMLRTIADWRSRLTAKQAVLLERFGPPTYDFFLSYFDAAIRRFASGHVDLLELTLRKPQLI